MDLRKLLFPIVATVLSGLALEAQDFTSVSSRSLSDFREKMTTELNVGLHPQIINIQDREKVSLDGKWRSIVDIFESGYYNYRLVPNHDEGTFFADKSYYDDPTKLVEYDFDTSALLNVPGDWNTQDDKLYYYEGTIWYRRKIDLDPKPGRRYFLYFGAANYETMVGVNGRVIGKHTGGYTPFNFEVTDLLKKGENTVIAKVDNKRIPEGVPTVNADWWNYGGIIRSVYIVETSETFVRDYQLSLKSLDGGITGWVQVDGAASAGARIKVEIPELKLTKEISAGADGKASFELKAKPELWSPENPKLYEVRVSACGDIVNDEIGFRIIETKGSKLFLNGKETFLRGICAHNEMPGGTNGRAYSYAQAVSTLQWAKELNCNFLRLAHYPHHEEMVRAAERMGLLVWDEIPVYWTIHWENAQTYQNAEQQLSDMIARDHNRANVIIWSVANETPISDARLTFLTSLINKAHALDPTRLVSSAMEVTEKDNHITVSDPLAKIADLMSFNQYVGWYNGESDKCDRVSWSFDIEKPVIITEWGGGALYGYHGDKSIRFTEEYQEYLYQKNVQMLSRIPGLAGSTPWILKDFRSPRRPLAAIQDDFNRKGLVSDQGQKKKAFYVLQEWYSQLEEKYKTINRK